MIDRRALAGLLLSSALVVGAGPVFAQDQAPTDAQRIAQMRDRAVDVSAPPLAEPTQEQAAGPKTLSEPTAGGGEAPAAERVAGVDAEADAQPLTGNEALPLGAGADGGGIGFFTGGGSDTSGSGAGGDNWMLSTLAALGVVIGLVFAIRWLMRRGGVVTTAAPKGALVEVLSRTTVAPRSHVVLMRVGQRILIVSDSPAGMRTLAQVADPEEVAELLGAIDASAPASMTDNFQGVMRKLSGQWSDNEASAMASDESISQVEVPGVEHGAVSSLRGRLAMLSKAGAGA